MISESAFMSFVQIKNREGFSETKTKQKKQQTNKTSEYAKILANFLL